MQKNFLRFLHWIGLTNLSDVQVEKATGKKPFKLVQWFRNIFKKKSSFAELCVGEPASKEEILKFIHEHQPDEFIPVLKISQKFPHFSPISIVCILTELATEKKIKPSFLFIHKSNPALSRHFNQVTDFSCHEESVDEFEIVCGHFRIDNL